MIWFCTWRIYNIYHSESQIQFKLNLVGFFFPFLFIKCNNTQVQLSAWNSMFSGEFSKILSGALCVAFEMLRFHSVQYLVLVSGAVNHVHAFLCSQVLDSSHLQPVSANNQQKAISIHSALLASSTERWCEVKHQWLIHRLWQQDILWRAWCSVKAKPWQSWDQSPALLAAIPDLTGGHSVSEGPFPSFCCLGHKKLSVL